MRWLQGESGAEQMKVRAATRTCSAQRLHMSNPCVARQMDPADSKQAAESLKLLHLHWIHSTTRTTLPSPPHDRLAARIKAGFGLDIEATVESHDARPRWVFFLLGK